jgi:endo-1,4-beta-D-glucanase Y
MFKKVLFSTVFSLFAVSSLFAAAKFPFPQDQNYPTPTAIRPANTDHNVVQAAYQVFMTNFYEENSNGQARIKWDTASQTVSEGIGYGMLILVWMDNAKNNTQAKFDKLWAYYQAHRDGNGLMDWKIQGFGGTANNGGGGATDGDLDVAFALCLAYYQWGDAKYKTDATALMGKIWQYEVSGGNMLYPGDQFKEPLNPSYFITAGLGMFNKIKFDNNNWAGVATGCYSLLKTISNKNSTGLVPDWCTNEGNPDGRGSDYTFDAARTPWRMAMAYCWYGDADAKTVAGKINTWIKTKTEGDPSQIMSGYTLIGAPLGTYNLPTYIGPFACAAMVDNGSQAWLDACYKRLASFIDNDNYYNQSLKVLSLLLLTGNALDFSSATPKTAFKITTAVSPASAGSVTVSPQNATYTAGTQVTFTATGTGQNKFVSWGGDLTGATSPQTVAIASDMNVTAYFNAGAADLIDDCEDGNNLNTMGGKWFSYNDVTAKGKSTCTPLADETQNFPMADGGANGTAKCAQITFKLDSGNVDYNPFVGIGFWLKNKVAGDSTVDISAATGLTFYFKGELCDVRVETTNITDYGYYFKRLPKSAAWTLISLKWSDMAQNPTWAVKKDLDLTKATKICWQTPDIGKTGDAGIIAIDDIHLPGYAVPVGTKQPRQQAVGFSRFSLAQTHPGQLAVHYPNAGRAIVSVFDLSGCAIAQKVAKGGCSAFTLDKSGIYLVRVKTANETFTGTTTVLK